MLGVGVLLLFFGVSMNAARVVRPLAAVLGAPARSIGGAPGVLARDNATRNPSRTASMASALMIGLALVTFVAIFSAGTFKSFEDAVDDLFIADYTVTATNTFTPIDVAVGESLVGKPGVSDVTAIRAGSAHFLDGDHNLSGVDSNIATGVNIDWKTGGDVARVPQRPEGQRAPPRNLRGAQRRIALRRRDHLDGTLRQVQPEAEGSDGTRQHP
jgi:putative ABC transport system permease protein